MIIADKKEGIFGMDATPKIITPATKDASDLWSLRNTTESRTELILGTMKGAIKLAERTAMIARSVTTPVTLAPIPLIETIRKF